MAGKADMHPKLSSVGTPINNEKLLEGTREWWNGKREKKAKDSSVHSPSGDGSHESKLGGRRSTQLESVTPIHGASSRDDLPGYSEVDNPPLPVFSPHVGKGSPQLLRRRLSRDELASPIPESRELNFGTTPGGRRELVGGGGNQQHSGSNSIRKGGLGVGISKGGAKGSASTEGVARADKSPEIMVDDVSGSSLSTSSFDISIQLMDATSPPHLILRVMENIE